MAISRLTRRATRAALVAALLFPVLVYAVQPATLVPHRVTRVVRAVDGTMTAGIKFRDAANAGRYASGIVTFTRPRVGQLIKGRLLNPGTWAIQAAITTAITAAGWFIDEITKEVLSPPPQQTGTVTGYEYRMADGTWTTNVYLAQQSFGWCTGSNGWTFVYASQSGGVYCTDGASTILVGALSVRSVSNACPAGYQFDAATGNCFLVDPAQANPTPASDDDVGRTVLPLLNPQVLPYLVQDPITGKPEPLPEIETERQRVQDIIRRQDDADPTNDPVSQDTIDPTEGSDTGNRDQPEDVFVPPGQPDYPTDLTPVDKRNLSSVLDGVAGQLQSFGNHVGINAVAGACTIAIPVTLGAVSGNGTVDFCQFDGALQSMGLVILSVAYLVAGLIVLRAE